MTTYQKLHHPSHDLILQFLEPPLLVHWIGVNGTQRNGHLLLIVQTGGNNSTNKVRY